MTHLTSFTLKRLPADLRYWTRLTQKGGLASPIQSRDWLLLLNAKSIPHRIVKIRGAEHLYVPSLLTEMATGELVAFARENANLPDQPISWPLHPDWPYGLLYLLLPICCYYFQNSPAPHFPPVDVQTGSLNGIRLWLHGEWWRLATALTLHSGLPHLVGNIFFGGIFIALLSRMAGIGHAWLITCLGGVAANFFSSLVHNLAYDSVGFSTAVFASIGAVAGLRLCQQHRRLFMPVAGAVALLAMLGTEGIRTDYAAHICGLGCGLILGLLEGLAIIRHLPLLAQWIAAALAWAIPVTGWIFAGKILDLM